MIFVMKIASITMLLVVLMTHTAEASTRPLRVRGNLDSRFAHQLIEVRAEQQMIKMNAYSEILYECSKRSTKRYYCFVGYYIPRPDKSADLAPQDIIVVKIEAGGVLVIQDSYSRDVVTISDEKS